LAIAAIFGALTSNVLLPNVTIRTSPLTGNLRKAIVLKTGRSEDDDESKLGIKDVLLNTKSNRTVGYQQKVFEIKKQPPHQLPAQNAKDKLLEISVKNAPVIVSITRSKSRVGYVSVKREEDGKGSKTLLVKALFRIPSADNQQFGYSWCLTKHPLFPISIRRHLQNVRF
jgi:hypothetical protein